MQYDFDRIIDRSHTGSIKWKKYSGTDVLPMWVADMEFSAPSQVLEAIGNRVDNGILGYDLPPEDAVESVLEMLDREYGWQVEKNWLVWVPGCVCGINIAARAYGEPGDEVMTAIPIYPPFLSTPDYSGRLCRTVPLKAEDGRYCFDYDLFEKSITKKTSVFLLCSPHNPVGRVWERDELALLEDICRRRNVVLVSDEIHCGLVLEDGVKHIPTATLSEAAAENTVTFMAPSKTYNIPGLGCSFAVIPNLRLRKAFMRAMQGVVPHVNSLGIVAAGAAYRECGQWHRQLIEYLRANRDYFETEISSIDGLSMPHVEATYLAWIDSRSLGLDNPYKFFEEKGKVGLSDGKDFGAEGFVRLNFGCPRSMLEEGVSRLKYAIGQL